MKSYRFVPPFIVHMCNNRIADIVLRALVLHELMNGMLTNETRLEHPSIMPIETIYIIRHGWSICFFIYQYLLISSLFAHQDFV